MRMLFRQALPVAKLLKRRLMAWVCCLALLFTVMPVTAQAAVPASPQLTRSADGTVQVVGTAQSMGLTPEQFGYLTKGVQVINQGIRDGYVTVDSNLHLAVTAKGAAEATLHPMSDYYANMNEVETQHFEGQLGQLGTGLSAIGIVAGLVAAAAGLPVLACLGIAITIVGLGCYWFSYQIQRTDMGRGVTLHWRETSWWPNPPDWYEILFN